MAIKARFQAKKLEGTYIKRKALYVPVLDEDGNKTKQRKLEYQEVEEDRGWMIYFPNGASIHIATEAEFKRMGYDKTPPLVDLETGDVVADADSNDLERHVERKTKPSRHSNNAIQKRG